MVLAHMKLLQTMLCLALFESLTDEKKKKAIHAPSPILLTESSFQNLELAIDDEYKGHLAYIVT